MVNIIVAALISSWNVSLTSMFNVSEAYYNDYWQGNDASNIAWVFKLDGEAKKDVTEYLFYRNKLALAYGQTFLKDNTTGNWLSPVKSTDKIEDENTLTLRKGWPVDPYASLYFLSMFFDEPHDMYVNPMTLQESFGFARSIMAMENASLTSRFGIAFKQVINRVDSIPTTKEGGIEWITEGKFKISDNALYQTSLRVFKALISSTSNTSDTWKAPDIKFENTLTVNVVKYVNISLYLMLFYDKDQIDKTQIKQTMSLGMTFNLL